MALKRECDRCHHLTLVDSLSDREMRVVHIERGATASSSGGATQRTTDYDLCKQCLIELDGWLKHAPELING
jgi:uncharacterized protein (DUF488 family)